MRWKVQILCLSLFLAFLVLTWEFAGPSGPKLLDVLALRTLLNCRSPRITSALVILTELGRTPVALIPGMLVWRRSRVRSIQLVSATMGGWLIGEIFKRLIERPRPADILPLVGASGYSFPSGHALVAAATYTTVAILACRRLHKPSHRILISIAAILLISIVAVSRVYLGVHYLSDVVGGILLGAVWAVVLAQVFKLEVPDNPRHSG